MSGTASLPNYGYGYGKLNGTRQKRVLDAKLDQAVGCANLVSCNNDV